MTSLTGNHVSGTTTITTATSITNNCVSGTNNNQQTSTTITPPITVTSGQQNLNKNIPNNTIITHQALINHNESGSGVSTIVNNQVTLSSTNNQHFVNLNNNNNSNISNSGAGNSINKFHANSNNELLANGHGPRRGVSFIGFIYYR